MYKIFNFKFLFMNFVLRFQKYSIKLNTILLFFFFFILYIYFKHFLRLYFFHKNFVHHLKHFYI
jgi:hypothetical protein